MKKESKKEIRMLKRHVMWINIKISFLFIYDLIFLFGFPLSVGYCLSLLNDILGIFVGFVLFWVHFAMLTNNNHLPVKKWEELDKEKRETVFCIVNHRALKNNTPTVHDPYYLDRF